MKFEITGKCRCCTNQKEAILIVEKYGNKIVLTINDCMGRARIELDNEDLKLLNAIRETEE